MNLNNISKIANMTFDKKIIKSLYDMYNMFKDDKNFSNVKFIRLIYNILKGEKIIKFENKYILSTFLPHFPSEAFNTNLKAVKSPIDAFTQQIYAKRTAPISTYLCVTNKCPNNCFYCSAKNRSSQYELTTNEWIKVIRDMQDMGTSIIGITGGEPMVREDIFEIVKSIDNRSSSILFTSGFNLTLEKAQQLKKSGLFGIGISLDSHNEDKHNKNRNSKQAFNYAVKALRNANNAGLYTMAQTVISREDLNEQEMFKLFKFAKENGVHEVKILEPILSGNLLTEKSLDKILYDKLSREKLIEIQHKANKRLGLPKISTFAYTESEEKYGCGAGTQHSYVSADGTLYPCDFVPMSFGNVRERSIIELWKEMNDIIGIPKIGCFAQRVNKQVYKESKGTLPLNKEASINICQNNISDKFPKYYRDLQ